MPLIILVVNVVDWFGHPEKQVGIRVRQLVRQRGVRDVQHRSQRPADGSPRGNPPTKQRSDQHRRPSRFDVDVELIPPSVRRAIGVMLDVHLLFNETPVHHPVNEVLAEADQQAADGKTNKGFPPVTGKKIQSERCQRGQRDCLHLFTFPEKEL